MAFYFSIRPFWRRQHCAQSQLPAHLPRFLLAEPLQPRFVRRCPVAQAVLPPLALLDWDSLPAALAHRSSGWRTVPLAAYVGAYLLKLDQQLPTFGDLRRFLRRHPALVWSLGFPLVPDATQPHRFDCDASLPTQRHFSRRLSVLPNDVLQNLLDGQVRWLRARLGADFGQVVSCDTRQVIASVRQNNPKVFIQDGRFDKSTAARRSL